MNEYENAKQAVEGLAMLMRGITGNQSLTVPDEIMQTINQNQSGDGPARDILPVPVNATLFRLSSCIEVEFLSNIGDVTIMLSNLMTGDYSITIFDSQEDTVILPFPSSSCLTPLSILLAPSAALPRLFAVLPISSNTDCV